MDFISPLPCPPEDLPQLPAAREALIVELEQRGRVALAALLPVLALLWVTLRRVAMEDRRIQWLLITVLLVGLIRVAIYGLHPKSPEARHLWLTTGSTTIALLLAATIWIAFPRLTPMETGILGMIAAGLGSGALVSMAPSPITYLAYLLPIIGSLAIASHAHPVPEYPMVFQALTWLFLGGLAALSLRVHTSLRNEILLRLRSGEMAVRDSLTGLHNRRFLAEFMETEVAQVLRSWSRPESRKLTLKLIMIDLDHFKHVNDKYGHDAGDAVLMQLAALLRDVLRRPDILVRWGGEEFLVVARDTGRQLPLGLTERIRSRVEEHVFQLPNGGTLHCTCSIGFALYPFTPDSPGQLNWEQCVGLADAGLYLAKEDGRNRWVGLELGDTPWDGGNEVYNALRANPAKAISTGFVRLIRQAD